MSDYNISSQGELDRKRVNFIQSALNKVLEEEKSVLTTSQYNREVQTILEKVGNDPLYQNRKITRNEVPYKEDLEADIETVSADLSILNSENETHGRFLKNSFNSVYSEKKRIMQRIDKLNSLTGDMFLITDKGDDNTYYITESFNDAGALDTEYTMNSVSKGSIQTNEGVLTLERTGSKNLSQGARVTHYTGNGDPGTGHLVRKVVTINNKGESEEVYQNINQEDSELNARIEDILDDRPDTLFEYQMVNVPRSFKKERRFYDFEWAKGKPQGERLRLKIIIELPSEERVNWITLLPYYPNNSIGSITIDSIRTSYDGFDYEPLYDSNSLNQKINSTPQTYRLGDVFTGQVEEDTGFYQGRGVWSFPERRARFIEFVIDQNESYPETLGQPVYYINRSNQTYPLQVPEPPELKDRRPGTYLRSLDGERVEYVKEIQATREGWRYSIGLRDINIMQFEFNDKSEFVSKRYELPRNIKKLNLYAKEIIPESYLDVVTRNNDWIKYEVSFDDINWYRISAMHHEPLNDNFPPKIIEVNTSMVDLNHAFQVHKSLINIEDPKHLRFRVSMRRPTADGYEATTPILEEVAIKVEMEDEL